jgi:ubiquinone/menaquinone biosynthesis C-methylase UbiE
MGFYTDRILPHLIRSTMRDERFAPYRERAVSHARGRVLEIGIGSGENLSRYGTAVASVIGLEPSARLAAMAKVAARGSSVPAEILETSAESIPLDARSIDTVVMTWTLCSVRDPASALREMHRVLKPGGHLLFAEHGLAPDRGVQMVQRWLTPLWKRVAGGCHLDRDMGKLIASGGFEIEHLATGYMRGSRPITFMYEGRARPHEGPAKEKD